MKRIFFSMFAVLTLTTAGLFLGGFIDKVSVQNGLGSSQEANVSRSVQKEWRIKPFQLVNDRGETFTHTQLIGKVWVVNFIFTNCGGPCPLLVEKFRALNDEFASVRDFGLLTITVDPETDTPDVLREYRNEKRALAPNWHFLTGAEEMVMGTINNLFEVLAGKDPELHTTKFILVDKQGQIVGAFGSSDESDLRIIRKEIHRLLKAES